MASLKDIKLEITTREQFREYEDTWKRTTVDETGKVYSILSNPIRAPNYHALIQELIETEFVDEIRARLNHTLWLGRYVRKGISEDDIEKMIGLAENNKFKRTFEIRIKRHQLGREDRSLIQFTRHGSQVVGYKMIVTPEQKDMFTLVPETEFEYNVGIWVPNGQI